MTITDIGLFQSCRAPFNISGHGIATMYDSVSRHFDPTKIRPKTQPNPQTFNELGEKDLDEAAQFAEWLVGSSPGYGPLDLDLLVKYRTSNSHQFLRKFILEVVAGMDRADIGHPLSETLKAQFRERRKSPGDIGISLKTTVNTIAGVEILRTSTGKRLHQIVDRALCAQGGRSPRGKRPVGCLWKPGLKDALLANRSRQDDQLDSHS